MLMRNRFNLMQVFKWTIEMVDDLLHVLGEFKANMEYRNVDFNAEKAKQYEALRKAMARKYLLAMLICLGDKKLLPFPKIFRSFREKSWWKKSSQRKR